MNTLDIRLSDLPCDEGSDLRALSVRVGDLVLTRLLRQDAEAPDDAVHVPAGALGFWLADHWWRLRWESRPSAGPTAEWRQAHELTSIGDGYAWPHISLWGEDARVGLIARSDPPGVIGPVRFLQDALIFVGSDTFETKMDHLLDQIGHIVGVTDRPALAGLLAALRAERDEPSVAAWRRMEAIAGFDADAAPERLIDDLLDLAARFAVPDVEEAAAATPGTDSARILRQLVDELPDSAFVHLSFAASSAVSTPCRISAAREPWRLAETAASQLRKHCDLGAKPLLNNRLAKLVGAPASILKDAASCAAQARPYGLRRHDGGSESRVLMQARWSHDRRFAVARALGDAIWSGNSPLGPISRASTARQKFQRAFAASLLCPLQGLLEYLGNDEPSDSDISAAARHFHVSERVVRSMLVNKRVVERHRIDLPSAEQDTTDRIAELVEAA